MAWIAWKTLTNRKKEGGLGFRDIQTFNDAMLAKLSWRILQNPQCLLGRILLGKYCHQQEFLKVKPTGTISHGWRSILAGRETLLGNIGWAIGDGQEIKIWQDNWLSVTHQEAPFGPTQEHLKDLLVADLIDPISKEWNRSKIHEILPHYEEKILNIKLSKQGAKDKVIWLKHYTGEYSVKSGYYSEIMTNNPQQADPIHEGWNWNQNIWNVKTVPKIKMFLWKAAKGALPTKERLLQRKILENPACSRCGEPESITHLLFHCPYAKQVWKLIPLWAAADITEGLDFKDIWLRVKDKVCLPPSGISIPLAPWICWNLWKARNNKEFNNRIFTSEETALKALLEAKEWYLAQSQVKEMVRTIDTRPRPENQLPVTCKSDGAWRIDKGAAGFGWVFFDNQGNQLGEHSESELYVTSALMAEGLALRAAMRSALDRGIQQISFESDSQQLIYAITQNTKISDMHGILHDIDELKAQFEILNFKLVKRALIAEADLLAKKALSICIANNV